MGATTSGQRERWRSVAPALLPTGRYGGQPVNLDLVDTLRSTGAARQFHPDPIDDDVLARLLDTARFAPSGGNRQGWRVIVVKDPAAARLRDLYLSGWYEYLAMVAAGLVPGPGDRPGGRGGSHRQRPRSPGRRRPPGLRRDARLAPALLLVLADLAAWPRSTATCPLHLRRRGLHLSLRLEPAPGGAGRGLGGVITTMSVRRRPRSGHFSPSPRRWPWRLVVLGRPSRHRAACGARP